MRAAGVLSHRRRIAAAAFAGAAIMLVACASVCAQSEPPVPITAADAARMSAAGGGSPSAAPGSTGAIAESPSSAPEASSSPSASSTPVPVGSRGWSRSRAAEIKTPVIEGSGVLMSPQVPPESTQVIPRAAPPAASQPDEQVASPESSASSSDNDIKSYQAEEDLDAQLGTLREFVAQGTETSEIGAQFVEARRKLDSGEVADGLLVVKVFPGSPAAKAGLQPFKTTAHSVLTGAVLAAAMVCPPAILALPVLDYTQIGESYDMVIGIDGVRVTNFMDFEDQMRKTLPGEIVYLSVIRNGKRVQIRVPIPSTTQTASQ